MIKLRNRQSGLYLRPQTFPGKQGDAIITATSRVNAQYWHINPDGTIASHTNSVLVLDIEDGSTQQGARVILCERTGQMNQKWTFDTDGTIRSELSGHVLEVKDSSTANGAEVIVSAKSNSENQQWTREAPQCPDCCAVL